MDPIEISSGTVPVVLMTPYPVILVPGSMPRIIRSAGFAFNGGCFIVYFSSIRYAFLSLSVPSVNLTER